MRCAWPKCDSEAKERGKYCSTKCKNKGGVGIWRRRLKRRAIEFLGGKCEICGYSQCDAAMEFHHKESALKEFGLGEKGHTRSWERVKKELEKCALLCCRCHRELHAEPFNMDDSKIAKWVPQRKPKPTVKCKECGKDFVQQYSDVLRCSRTCSNESLRKVKRVGSDELAKLRETMTWEGIGSHLGVSSRTVRDWAISYGILVTKKYKKT